MLEDARVGDDAVLGEMGRGFGIALAGLDGGRIGIAAQSMGIARAVLDRSIAYGRERRQFGQPIAEFEAIRFKLAERATDLDAARLLALRAAWLRDRGRAFTREASMAKLFASEAAQRITDQALQIFGGYGYMRDYAVERYARDARARRSTRARARCSAWSSRDRWSPHDAPEEQDREAALARRDRTARP